MTSRNFTRYAWAVLVMNLFVILWGAYVRASGSGAGCGSHWPLCNGEVVPKEPGVQTLIEYSHRLSSGVALLMVIGLLVWAWRLFPARHRVRRAAIASMVLILTEAGIGAGLVLFELVADNDSLARGWSMAMHLNNTFLLLGAVTLTAYWSTGAPAPTSLWGDRSRNFLWYSIVGMMVVGTSGAIAALGDTLFPAESLAEGLAQDLSPSAHIFVQLRVLHPFLAVGLALLILSMVSAVRASTGRAKTRQLASAVHILVIVQILVGGINIILLAPIWLQLVHLLIADLLWIALIMTSSEVMAEER